MLSKFRNSVNRFSKDNDGASIVEVAIYMPLFAIIVINIVAVGFLQIDRIQMVSSVSNASEIVAASGGIEDANAIAAAKKTFSEVLKSPKEANYKIILSSVVWDASGSPILSWRDVSGTLEGVTKYPEDESNVIQRLSSLSLNEGDGVIVAELYMNHDKLHLMKNLGFTTTYKSHVYTFTN